MTSYVFLGIIIALFVLYIILCHEKSTLFYLGVAWFSVDIIIRIASIVYFSLITSIDTAVIFDYVNKSSIILNGLKNLRVLLLFLIVIFFFIRNKNKRIPKDN